MILMSGAAYAGDGEDLLKAAFTGDLAQVRTLLDKGTDIDHQSGDGLTALMQASYQGHQEIVQALLAEGANVELRENGGGTALKHAKTEQIKQLLRAAGATQ